MNFIKYLERIAPEGESVLLVKQIAKDNGQFAWPAYLPAKYDGKGAWYGNTASFITSRFKEGKPSASAGNCEYVAFLDFQRCRAIGAFESVRHIRDGKSVTERTAVSHALPSSRPPSTSEGQCTPR
jgi:hypothetical protein